MRVFTAIKTRRSVRVFKKRKPSMKKLMKVIEAARLSPSGANRQPLVAVVVDDPCLKASIRSHCEQADKAWWKKAPAWFRRWARDEGISLNKGFLTSAPYVVCVFGDSGAPYWLESVWICIGYMTLAATEENMGCLTYTPGDLRFLNPLLRVPARLRPVAILPVGYAAEPPRDIRVRRKPLGDLAFLNRYGCPLQSREMIRTLL
jgi:nitroreductase